MANKKISELTTRTPSLSDLLLVGDPSTGFSFKCTVTALATIIETDIADGYVTLGTTQTISGAKTFSNNLTLTSVTNASVDTDKFLVLNGSNIVNFRTGSEVLSDIGGQGTITLTTTGTSGAATFTSNTLNIPQYQGVITLTTTGTSGAATLVGNTLNIPNYAPDLSGYVPTSRTITINGNTQDLTANRTYNVGTVTSVAASAGTGISISGSPITSSGTITITNTAPDQIVALTAGTGISISGTYPNFTITNSSPSLGGTVTSVALSAPTGFAVTGSPITSSGTLALAFDTGYSLPTTASQTNWDTAYTNRITSLTTTGSSGSATLISNTLNIPTYTLAGLGGISLSSLSATLPLGYNSTTGQFSISQANSTTSGFLSDTDWNTFNNKQATITLTTTGTSGAATFTSNTLNIPQYQGALTLTTTGTSGAATLVGNTLNIPQYSGGSGTVSGTTNYVAKFTSSTAVGDSQIFDNGTNVGINNNTPAEKLSVIGNAQVNHVYTHTTGSFKSGLLAYTQATTAGLSNFTGGMFYGASQSTYENTVQGSITVPNDVILSAQYAQSFIKFQNASTAITMTQGTGIRAITSQLIQFAIGNAQTSSSISHVAGIQLLAPYYVSTNNPTITNYYGIVLNDTTEYNTWLTITNRWGIYQAGASDRNYFAGNTGLGTTTIGSRLQVNGNAAIGYSASTAAPTNGLAVAGDFNAGAEIYRPVLNSYLRLNGGGSGVDGAAIVMYGSTHSTAAGRLSLIAVGSERVEINTNATERMRITSGGTVIVGNGETAGTPNTGIISATGGTGSNIAGAEFRIRGGASTGSGAGGPITFYTSAAGSAGTSTNAATEVARFTTTGRLGLGTNDPLYKLEIFESSTDPYMNFYRTTNGTGIGLGRVSWDGYRGTNTRTNYGFIQVQTQNTGATTYAGQMVFLLATGGSVNQVGFVNENGNWGLGTNTIGSRLQVNGNAAIGYSASTAAPTNGLAVAGIVNIGGGTSVNTLNLYNADNAGITLQNATTGTTGNDGFYLGQLFQSNNFLFRQRETADIIFETNNGTERLRIASGGTVIVGNGETAGTPTLGIISATGGTGSNIAGAEFRIRGGASTGSGAGGPITFYTSAAGSAGTGVNAATERMRLDASGNLGLGTNSPVGRLDVFRASTNTTAFNEPQQRLVNSGTATANQRVDLMMRWEDGTYNGSGGISMVRESSTARNGALVFSSINSSGNATEALRLNAGGNVGIGTATIGSTLQVNGNAAIGYSASTAAPTNGLAVSGNVGIGIASATRNLDIRAADPGMTLRSSNTTGFCEIYFGDSAGEEGRILYGNNGDYMAFYTLSTERMRITSGGEMQLKPAANTAALTTSGQYSLTGANAQSLLDLAGTWNTTGNPTAIKLNITNTASGATANLMDLQVGGTSEFKVTKAGYVGINQGTPTSMLHTQGSVATAYSSKTATYTLTGDDHTVLFNAVGAAANLTANLPDATTCTGRIYVIIGVVSGSTTNVTIDGNGTQTIGGSQTYTFWNACETYGTLIIQSDGSNWQILSQYIESSGC